MLSFLLSVALIGAAAQGQGRASVVLTLTNDATDNEVVVGVQVAAGLFEFDRFSTGGTGTGAGLGSQGALVQSRNGRNLLAVNAGSNDVTWMERRGPSLFPRDRAATGGLRPTSVDVHGDLVYALNAGSDDLTGFRMVDGKLQLLGRFSLSGAGVAAAQVGFDPSGDHVVVTERATQQILVFPVMANGTLGTPTVNASAGTTPFGFSFRQDGTLIVSEAAGGQAGLSTVSTYSLSRDGSLEVLTAAAPTHQTAACWIALPRNGRFAYTTNTGSGSISGFRVSGRGALSPLDSSGVTGSLGPSGAPLDAEFERSGRVLFVLDSGNDELTAFARDARGGLHRLPFALAVPSGAAGLVAR